MIKLMVIGRVTPTPSLFVIIVGGRAACRAGCAVPYDSLEWTGGGGYLPNHHKLNAIQLYNYINKIIGLFENRNISPSMHALNAKSELEKYDGVKKSEEIFDESTGERVKFRSQKSDGFNKMITEKD